MRGGGFFIHSGGITVHDSKIIENSALGEEGGSETGGGGIFAYSGGIKLNNCTVEENTSYTVGGVYCRATNLTVQGKTTIIENIGDAKMANVYLGSQDGVITIESNKLDAKAKIGVSKAVNDAVPTSFKVTSGLKGQYDGNNFVCDNYKLYWFDLNDAGEIVLKKTYYWDEVRWASSWDDEVYFVKADNKYKIDAPVIIRDSQSIEEGYDISYENKAGDPSTRAAIFIDHSGASEGQLLYNGKSVNVSFLTNIAKAAETDKGWYTIATPVGSVNLYGEYVGVNLVTAVSVPYNFDLLRYDEVHSMWETYTKPGADFHKLQDGRGYLYRNLHSITIEYIGSTLNEASYDLSYSPETAYKNLEGWNLIGNPYTHDIYKGKQGCAIENGDLLTEGFYRIKNDGKWGVEGVGGDVTPLEDGTAIKAGEGILVKALKAGKLVINNTNNPPSIQKSNNEFIRFTVANSNYDDEAYAVFDEGYGLPKINHRNEDIPMVYINKEDDNYAIAMMNDDVKLFNLNFKAKTTGQYTLSCNTEGDFSYLHVIDKLAGRDIDMLLDEKYTFIGSPRDTDARFVVRLSYNGDAGENEEFAYQNGNDIVVCGEGELQVYDVMGRFVTSQRINGVETINLNTTGVYILKLIGEETHTQKLVVR